MNYTIARFRITAGLTLIHAQYTSRKDKTQRLPANRRKNNHRFIMTSFRRHIPHYASPAVIPNTFHKYVPTREKLIILQFVFGFPILCICQIMATLICLIIRRFCRVDNIN